MQKMDSIPGPERSHMLQSNMCLNYWNCALEPESRNYWDHVPQIQKPVFHNERLMQWVIGTLQLKELLLASTREKCMQPWRPCIAKYKQINKKYFKKIIDIKEKKEKTFIAFYTTLGPRSNSLQVLNHPSTLGLIKDFSLNFFRSLLPSSSDNSVRLVLYKKLLIP